MEPHPDFADTELPREARLPSFLLTPLAPAVAEEDFEAVTSSLLVLKGVFGDDWPEGLTLEANRIDMGWHEREFTAKRSFAWVFRDHAEAYLGCAYIYPAIARRGSAQVITWVRDLTDRLGVIERFNGEFAEWIAPNMPKGVTLSWTSSPETGRPSSILEPFTT